MHRQDQTSCLLWSSWTSFRIQLVSLQMQSLQKQSVLKLFSHCGRRYRKILWNKINLKKKVTQTATVLLELCSSDLLVSILFSFSPVLWDAWFNISNSLPFWSRFTRHFEVIVTPFQNELDKNKCLHFLLCMWKFIRPNHSMCFKKWPRNTYGKKHFCVSVK